MSVMANPVTGSLNEMTTGIDDALVGLVTDELRLTVGRVVLYTRLNRAAATLVLPTAFWATSAGMSAVTIPSAAGMRSKE